VAVRIYGRSGDLDLVHRQLVRSGPQDPDADDGPVIVFEGAAGAGKTTLVRELDSSCAGTVARAYLDLAGIDAGPGRDPVLALLAALGAQLARRCRLHGSLSFDRLVIGLLAVAAPLDPNDPEANQRVIGQVLAGRRSLTRLKRVLAGVADAALSTTGVTATGLVTQLTDWLVDGVASRLPGRRAGHQRARQWYGHPDGEDSLSAVDQLMELHWSTRPHGRPDGRRAAHRLLWRALLADLRDNYTHGRRAAEWTSNALVLLDNADCPLGLEFLREVVRPAGWGDGPGPGAPLTMVVTSRGALLGELLLAERRAVHRVDVPAAPARPERLPPARWARRVLPGLGEAHLVEMFGRSVRGEDATLLAQQLVELTGGHPEGVTLLWDLVRADGAGPIDPERLLTRRDRGVPVEAVLRARLLRDVPADEVEALATAALARTEGEARRLLRRRAEWQHVTLPIGMWQPAPGAHTTLLRLLLQREVARRAEHPWNWSATHRELAKAAEAGTATRLYHLLADRRVDEVVAALSVPARRPATVSRWLGLLDAVVTAPHHPDPPGAAPAPAQAAAPGDDHPRAFVRTLVTVGWAAHSPTLGADRSGLYRRLAGAYARLSEHLGQTSEEVSDRVARYEDLARRWKRPALPGADRAASHRRPQ